MSQPNPKLHVVLIAVLLLNAVLSFWNVFEDGATARRLIPAICWSVAAVLWLLKYPREGQG